jgi:hypothetical protein
MKTCTVCKGSIAYPEIQGKTHFVCDGRVPAKRHDSFIQGMIASQSSADARWTRIEQNQVDAAIAHVAKTKGIFTADDVWQHLGDHFPVTKGLAGRLNAASRRGIIRNTGELAYANRGGAHDHAQRLSVWAGI